LEESTVLVADKHKASSEKKITKIEWLLCTVLDNVIDLHLFLSDPDLEIRNIGAGLVKTGIITTKRDWLEKLYLSPKAWVGGH
jgi:hypothetical protein